MYCKCYHVSRISKSVKDRHLILQNLQYFVGRRNLTNIAASHENKENNTPDVVNKNIESSKDDKTKKLAYSVCENNVTQQTSDDLSKFYTIPNHDTNTILSNVLPRRFKELSQTINESTIMVRNPSLSIIEALKDRLNAVPKFLIYGPDGSGKSLTMLQVLYYCLLNDWVVIHVPNAFRFVDSQKKTDVQQSLWNERRADQPKESILWLNMFQTMNGKFLLETKTSQEYKWGQRETTLKDRPLMEVINQGVGRSVYASDAVGVILKEVQLNKQRQVLYAIDGFNGLFGNTSHKLNGKTVNLENLSMVHHFTKLLKAEHSIENGAYMMALSQSVQYLKGKSDVCSVDTLLGDNVLSSLGDYTTVEVPDYNEFEFNNILNFNKDKGWLVREVTKVMLDEVQFMTQRNPMLVEKFCSSI